MHVYERGYCRHSHTCITCHTGPGCPSQQRDPLVEPPWEACSLARLTISLSEALLVRLETRATELRVPVSHVVRDPGNGPVLPAILSRGDLCGPSPGGARGLQCWSSCTFAESRLFSGRMSVGGFQYTVAFLRRKATTIGKIGGQESSLMDNGPARIREVGIERGGVVVVGPIPPAELTPRELEASTSRIGAPLSPSRGRQL